MQVLSTLLAAVYVAAVQADSATPPSAPVSGAIVSGPLGPRSVCLDGSECFPVRTLNDTSAVKQLALEAQTHAVVPQTRYLCFDETLEHCVVEDKAATVQVADGKHIESGGQLESIGCIFFPWGMLCNDMS